METCLCCSGKNFNECCEPYLSDAEIPTTPEALMRSRYTAFARANVEYVANTMKSPAADHFDLEDARVAAQQLHWDEFEIVNSSVNEDKATVEYIAYFIANSMKHKLHKLCELQLTDGKWYYINAQDMYDQQTIH